MDEIYILPSVDHLTEKEIDFELNLRKQTVDKRESLEDKRRFLRRLFSEDRKNLTRYQGIHNIKDQESTIEKNIKFIIEGLHQKFDRILISRLRHYLIRAQTASAKDEEELCLKESICSKIKQTLREFHQEIFCGASNQTEKDLTKGDLASNLSWRNPDPKALQQSGSINTDDKPGLSDDSGTKVDSSLSKFNSESKGLTVTVQKGTDKTKEEGDKNSLAWRSRLSGINSETETNSVRKSLQYLELGDSDLKNESIEQDKAHSNRTLETSKGAVSKLSNSRQNDENLDEERSWTRKDQENRKLIREGKKFQNRNEEYIDAGDRNKPNQGESYPLRVDRRIDNRRSLSKDRTSPQTRNEQQHAYHEETNYAQNVGRNYHDYYQNEEHTRNTRRLLEYRDNPSRNTRVNRPTNDHSRYHRNRSQSRDSVEYCRRRSVSYERNTREHRRGRSSSRERRHIGRRRDSRDSHHNRRRSISRNNQDRDSDRDRREHRGDVERDRGSYGRRHRRYSSSESNSPDRFRNRYRKSRVHDWDLSFSGDSRSIQVEDFLSRIKKLAHHEGVSNKELLLNIHHRLKGEAYDWWFTREDRFTRWEKFEDEIRFRYGNPNRDRGIRAQIRELKQKKGETFIAYVTEVEKLNQCLHRPFSSRTLFELIWENMRPHYRSRLSVLDIDDLEDLIRLNHKIDANDPNFYKPIHGNRGEIHHIDVNDSYSDCSDDDNIPIQALQKRQRDARKAEGVQVKQKVETAQRSQQQSAGHSNLCWNCQTPGHSWRECSERKLIFCYACGQLGRTTRTCENNHPQTSRNNFSNNPSTN